MSEPLQPAYVLHSRPYRDTSALVDLLSLRDGLQRVVWRGAQSSGEAPRRSWCGWRTVGVLDVRVLSLLHRW